VERDEAYLILIEHQPVPARLTGLRCSQDGDRYPCEAREQALDELTGHAPLVSGAVKMWSAQ
jgi:hypothetical protein